MAIGRGYRCLQAVSRIAVGDEARYRIRPRGLRFRRLGRRLVYIERPDLLRPVDRSIFDAEVARRVRGGDGDFHWLTLPQALAELEELIASSSEEKHERFGALREEMMNLASG